MKTKLFFMFLTTLVLYILHYLSIIGAGLMIAASFIAFIISFLFEWREMDMKKFSGFESLGCFLLVVLLLVLFLKNLLSATSLTVGLSWVISLFLGFVVILLVLPKPKSE